MEVFNLSVIAADERTERRFMGRMLVIVFADPPLTAAVFIVDLFRDRCFLILRYNGISNQ